jgi:flagellar hook-associated protein 1 FlgK
MTILDEKNAPVGMDEKTTVGETLFSRVGVDRYEDVKVTVYRRDENGQIIRDIDGNALTEEIVVKKYVEENPENKSTLYTISELQVNPEVIHNYSKLPLSTLENNNEYGYNTVVIDLVEVWDKEFAKIAPGTMTNYNFQDYYTAMIEDMGNVGYTMKIMMEGQQTMVDSANDTRENYMGVSTDEELSNLMKSQNAYNASSRYFNVINSMLETLILGLG